MKISWKKVAMWSIPIVIGGGVLWWITRKTENPDDDGNSPGPVADATGPTAPVIKPTVVTNSSFPLKQGSRNGYVTKLQEALKVTADGIFGPKTEDALKSVAGITVIKDQAELDAVIKKAATGQASTSRALELFSKFQKGNFSIQPTQTKIWEKVDKDAFGAFQRTGTGVTLYKGTKYSNQDYSLKETTKLGSIIIEINKGNLAGLYIGDPSTLTLV